MQCTMTAQSSEVYEGKLLDGFSQEDGGVVHFYGYVSVRMRELVKLSNGDTYRVAWRHYDPLGGTLDGSTKVGLKTV